MSEGQAGGGASRGKQVGRILAFIAFALAIVSIFVWPFLFAPIAALLVLIAAKMSDDARLTTVTATMISVCFVIGAAVAVLTRRALY
jgi:glucan phosphoethanolaminetransferase (alkaline phosphatase superfamily)